MSQRGNNAVNRGRRRYHRPPPQKRAPLNCIVDEGALIAGLADATDHGDSLKTWVREGAINLYVPLYTLEKLNMMRSSPPPLNLNARKALEWLDHITSLTENKTAGHVGLQGPDDQYQTWEQVEKYLLPETPLSSDNVGAKLDDITNSMEETMRIQEGSNPAASDAQSSGAPPDRDFSGMSPHSPTSPKPSFLATSPALDGNHTRGFSESSALSASSAGADPSGSTAFPSLEGTANIPSRLRPLLNYVVWRTHHEDVSSGNSAKYILLTNDPSTRKQAQQFGVRAKLLSQLRFIVARDKSKSGGQGHGQGPKNNGRGVDSRETTYPPAGAAQSKDEEDGEDEVVFKPKRPNSGQLSSPTPDVWDPDHFGRMPVMQSAPHRAIEEPETSERGRPGARGRGQTRSSRQQRDSQRGRPSPRGTQPKRYEKPIDPDSFARPPPQGRRGRGAFRRLWEPEG